MIEVESSNEEESLTSEQPKKKAQAKKAQVQDDEWRKRRYHRVPSSTKLASKLLTIRRRSNLTQGQLLVIINPLQDDEDNRARISQYERGHRVPSLIEVMNYARFYGVSMETLVDDEIELPDV